MRTWAAKNLPIIYGVIHALVDASSAMVLFASLLLHHLSPVEGFYLVLTYDLLAFGLQVFFGAATDKIRRPKVAVYAGLGLLAGGVVMLPWEPITAAILVGLGNAAFHVGGGVISLRMEPRRATAPGVFVGPGALGLAFGVWLGRGGFSVGWPFVVALLLAIGVTRILPDPPHGYVMAPKPETSSGAGETGYFPKLVVGLLLFSIVIRSLVGMAGSYRCPKEVYVMFGLALAAMGGKVLGGVVSDRLGWLETSVVALLLSAPPLVVGLVVGLAIAIFQATTQIQEMTITFVPKIVAVMLSLLFFASWMMIKLNDYTYDLLARIPDLVR